MKKKLTWSAVGIVGLFAVLQLFNPARENPAVRADFLAATRPPPAVAAGLRAACYDCHSNETRWPWYARLAPVSWLIARDVNEGRQHLNLSAWSSEPARAAKNLDRMNEVIDYREMPPAKYTLLHPAARLDASRRQDILDWTAAAAEQWRGATNLSPHAPL